MTVGEFRWGGWEAAPVIPHLDQTCASCSRPGPGLLRYGWTLQPGQRVRAVTRHSDVTRGVRAQARTAWREAYWALTHVGFRCPGCGEEVAFTESAPDGSGMEEVDHWYRPPGRGAEVIIFPGSDQDTHCNQGGGS